MIPATSFRAALWTLALLQLTVQHLPSATVQIRIVDHETSRITPAMVCILGADDEVRIPPDGKILTAPGTWSSKRGPAVIRKELESIDAIEKEFTPPRDARAEGILERLNRARMFYRQLLVEMSEG